MGVAEHGVGHAADEEGHAGPPPPDAGEKPREPGAVRHDGPDERRHASQPAGNEPKQAQPLGEVIKPHALSGRTGFMAQRIRSAKGNSRSRTSSRNQSHRLVRLWSASWIAMRKGSISRP